MLHWVIVVIPPLIFHSLLCLDLKAECGENDSRLSWELFTSSIHPPENITPHLSVLHRSERNTRLDCHAVPNRSFTWCISVMTARFHEYRRFFSKSFLYVGELSIDPKQHRTKKVDFWLNCFTDQVSNYVTRWSWSFGNFTCLLPINK